MPVMPEKRRSDREKYTVLRFYAKLLSVLSYFFLTLGATVAVVLALVGPGLPAQRLAMGFLSLVAGGLYYVLLQAGAQAIYLLFDMARNSKATRTLLEQAGPHAQAVPGG